MYIIEILVNYTADTHGWNDFITLKKNTGEILYSGLCRATPNPVNPFTRIKWDSAYGVLAPQVVPCETIESHQKFGKCVFVNNGSGVRARFPNPNPTVSHHGIPVLKEIFVHKSWWRATPYNPGSAGCITMKRGKEWNKFAEALPVGEGLLVIKDNGLIS